MQANKHLASVLIIFLICAFPFLLGSASTPAVLPAVHSEQLQQNSISTCMNRVNIPDSEMHWLYIPTSANELYSDDNLLWLAGNLIDSKVVDASSCPAGGLGSDGYANACGMSLAKAKVIEIQNSLNQPILDAWVEVGVPPVMLKQMIHYESQFWPSQVLPFHYGYGHITPVGMLNALEWNPELLSVACANTTGVCGVNETAADTLLQMMITTCPTCENGIDQARADRSVNLMANVVMGYCEQTAQLVFNATGWRSSNVVDYPTIWKLTLMNYNAGSVCVFNSVAATFKQTKGPMKWSDILAHVTTDQCKRGAYYANQVTAKAYDFPPK